MVRGPLTAVLSLVYASTAVAQPTVEERPASAGRLSGREAPTDGDPQQETTPSAASGSPSDVPKLSASSSGAPSEAGGATRPDPEPSFGATATVSTEVAAEDAVQAGEAPRRVPGTFGDPYRVFESMPGATPMVSGLPYVYVRGSPPSGNAYYYDDIPLPQLFHLGVGPSIMHPLFLGQMAFHPGVSPARYGRRLGAVIAGDGPDPVVRARGETEIRLLDTNGAIAVPVGSGHVMAAGRFGYPGLIAPSLGIDLSFSYWDYQFRTKMPLDQDDHIEVVAFGSFDTLSDAEAVGATIGYTEEDQLVEEQQLELEFHRIEARLVRKRKNFELGTAFRFGADRTNIGEQVSAHSLTLAPRLWLAGRLSGGHILRAGADVTATSGRVRELPLSGSFTPEALRAVSRNTLGAYVDATVRLASWSSLMLGLRTDAWIVGGHLSPSVDPRIRWALYPTHELELHAGVGMVHQPVVFAFPLPGFTDVALDRGLQEGIQSELGAGYDLFGEARLEASVFVHRYSDLLLPELYLRALGDGAGRADALSYGLEVFLVRAAQHDLSGWVSYTLGFAEGTEAEGNRTFDPEFDIRHVLNLVAEARLGAGWSLSLGARLRSGKPINQFTDAGIPPAYEVRLPAFFRLDGRIAYGFPTMFARMEVYAEMLNILLAREAIDVECLFGSCRPVEAQPIWFPNLGVRAGFY